MVSVILSGDDFGLAPAINEGIIRAHTHGCLTSASFCSCGAAAESAARAARRCPALGLGFHLTLVEERPVSPPESVPSLVTADGRFLPSGTAFARKWLSGRIRSDAVRREFRAQLSRMLDLGLHPTHLDSHDHIHVLPGLLEVVIEEMQRAGLRRMRVPGERGSGAGAGPLRRGFRVGLNVLSRRARGIARRAGIAVPDHFVGFLHAGHLDLATLLPYLETLRPGVTEIAFHPAVGGEPPRPEFAGWGYRWDVELATLTDHHLREALDRHGVVLQHFGEAFP